MIDRFVTAIIVTFVMVVVVSMVVAEQAAAATPPQSYAAVAFSPSLKILRAGFGSSAPEAEMAALNACLGDARGRSGYYKDCAAYGWVRNGWVGFARQERAPRQLDWAWGSGWGHTASRAQQAATRTCLSFDRAADPVCTGVGSSPFRSHAYNSAAETTGGRPTVTWTTAPLPPSDLRVFAISPNGIRLTWRNAASNVQTDESGFQVSNGDDYRYTRKDVTSWDWTGLRPGQYMCFRVRAFNGVGNSRWEPEGSPWYRCTTTPSP